MRDASIRHVGTNGAKNHSTALKKLFFPLSMLLITWTILTVAVFLVAVNTNVSLHYYLLFSSILSLIAGGCTLFAGYMASEEHRKIFSLIYALTGCYIMFVMKMFLTAIMVVTGHDLAWQEKHTSWCYTMALWGQIFFMTSLGYTAVIIINILFVLAYPMYYNRNKDTIRCTYHVIVWLVAIGTCIPAVAAGAIGDYIWLAGAFDVLFDAFALISIVYLMNVVISNDKRAAHSTTASVLHQSILIAIGFIVSYIWNWIFRLRLILGQPAPRWLNAVQIFWLGGVGWNNALVWFPFILKAFQKARRVAVFMMVRQPTGEATLSQHTKDNRIPLDALQLELFTDISKKRDFDNPNVEPRTKLFRRCGLNYLME